MSIDMVDLHGQYLAIKDEVDAAIQEVVDRSAFIKGEAVSAFERELAEEVGGGHALGVGSGTDALQIAMMAAGVEDGDEVITTPFTFVATAEAAALLGARPVFVDVDPETFNLDVGRIEERITERTAAIVPVHLYGQPCEMDPLLEIARRHDLTVIEDAAQAVGATYRGESVGLMGEVGCLSFFPSKNLGAFGDGGAVLTRDADLAERLRMIANHGSRKKYHNEVVGVNSRLDSIQAAVLRVKLRHLETYTQARRGAADRYDRMLAEVDGIRPPHRAPDRRHVFHQYTIRFEEAGRERRDAISEGLRARDIPHAIYYPKPLHLLPVFEKISSERPSLPEAERASEQVLSLPMHTELTADQQERVVAALVELMN